jgi:hypothetical protein
MGPGRKVHVRPSVLVSGPSEKGLTPCPRCGAEPISRGPSQPEPLPMLDYSTFRRVSTLWVRTTALYCPNGHVWIKTDERLTLDDKMLPEKICPVPLAPDA